ncbi:ribonuclease H-like domain-containing protein [Tanacetum coccineum]
MSIHGYTDDEYNVGDNNITPISKLDVSNPLHLHPNDSATLTVVSVKLKRIENYQVWSCAMLLALEGKNKIGFIDETCKRRNFLRSQTPTSFPKPYNVTRPNDNENIRTVEGSNLVCENCGFNGHTIDRCFKIIGYTAGFEKNKGGQNFKGKSVSNNVVGYGSSSGFSDE